MNRRFLISLPVLIGLALSAVTLAGCSTNPATGKQSFTGFMSPAEERSIGAKEHPKLVKAFGGEYRDPVLKRYLDGLGLLLQSTSEQPKPPFTFTLLDSPVINAFAVPGGYVYITRGLMALANDEAELAGVVAHEIGHVTARHTAERVSRGMLANIGAAVLGVVVGQPLLSNAARLAAGAYIQGYSRDQEFEADQLGVRYLTRAGFDPQAMASFLGGMGAEHQLAQKIAGKEGRDAAGGLFASHPRTAARVEKAAARARARAGTSLARDRDIYLNQIDGMVYGDSPDQGYIRGREFDHAGLKFRFTAPPGFRLHNSETAVLGEHSGGAVLRFDSDKPKGASGSMETYLTRQCAKGLRVTGVESITMTQKAMPDPNPWVMQNKPGIYMVMGQTAEVVAQRYGISRERQDEYALESQRLVSPTAIGQHDVGRSVGRFALIGNQDRLICLPLRSGKVVREETGRLVTPQCIAKRNAAALVLRQKQYSFPDIQRLARQHRHQLFRRIASQMIKINSHRDTFGSEFRMIASKSIFEIVCNILIE